MSKIVTEITTKTGVTQLCPHNIIYRELHSMDYQKHYTLLVEQAKARDLPKETYTEKHHIIPRCIGGNNSKENIAQLTAEEHFLAHLLLYKIYPGNHKLACAILMMTADRYGHRVNNKLYGWIKRKLSEDRKGKSNIELYGEKKAEEMRQQNSLRRKGKTYLELFGEEKSKEIIRKRSKAMIGSKNSVANPLKGKKLHEIVGLNKAEELIKQRRNQIPYQTGKTYEELFGIDIANKRKMENSKRIKGKTNIELYGEAKAAEISKKAKGRIPWNKGKTYEEMYGTENATQRKSNLSLVISNIKQANKNNID